MDETLVSSGKVRELYDAGDGKLLIAASDRVSAFDVILPDKIADKGRVLTGLSAFWFNRTKRVIKNHMISVDVNDFPERFKTPDFAGRSMLVKKLTILPAECIVSGYLTGSNFKSYSKNGLVCGQKLPDGLVESEKLERPIFCPSTKAEAGEHDEYITFERMKSIVGAELAESVKAASLAVYEDCAAFARTRGIIIADAKFEFGMDNEGELTLADEILTPDSSRFWPKDEYEAGRTQKSFDKQFLRDWLTLNNLAGVTPPPAIPAEIVNKTRDKYLTAYEIITGRAL